MALTEKERHERYRAKPGVREKERDYARKRIARMYQTEEGRAHLRALSFKNYHHGVTREEADAMIAAQSGLCAICNEAPTGKGHCSRLHVDHDHKTGKIRGMLCSRCNKGLGSFQDSPEALRSAADYLDNH